jgi:Spy/CpxP family protein refolding chaperone
MKSNLKTFALSGVLALGAASSLLAQEPRRGHEGRQSVETRVSRMRESLNLSDQQASRIEAILKEVAAKPAGGERENRIAQRQEVRRQIDAVLTPEQREKRDQIAGERKGKGGRRGQRRQR